MSDPSMLDDFIHAAAVHGRDSAPDHEVGDLQDMLRVAWKIMTPEQRIRFMNHETPQGIKREWNRS